MLRLIKIFPDFTHDLAHHNIRCRTHQNPAAIRRAAGLAHWVLIRIIACNQFNFVSGISVACDSLCLLQALRDHVNFVGPNCPTIFMDRQGRSFQNATLSLHWTKWLDHHAGCRMPPSQCRQVFVDERRGNKAVAGPSDAGAAHIMGHSVAQWDAWYDKQFYARQGQNAVNAMDTWRQNLLREAGVTESVPAREQEQVTVRAVPDLQDEDSFKSCASSLEDTEDMVIELE